MSKQIRVGEVMLLDDAKAKRLMWTTGVLKNFYTGETTSLDP